MFSKVKFGATHLFGDGGGSIRGGGGETTWNEIRAERYRRYRERGNAVPISLHGVSARGSGIRIK